MIRLISIAVLCMPATPLRAQDPTRVMADEWPPFSGERLPGRGISVDVITQLLTRAGYQVESETLPWAKIMGQARSDRFDIIRSLLKDPEIAEFMYHSGPFLQTPFKFLRRMGMDHTVAELGNLEQYSIAVDASPVQMRMCLRPSVKCNASSESQSDISASF